MFKQPSENAIAVTLLGLALIVAEFQAVPASSHDFVLATGAGLVGYIAKSAVNTFRGDKDAQP